MVYKYTYFVVTQVERQWCNFRQCTNPYLSLYSLIWDFFLSQINIWTTTTWSNVWVALPKPSWHEFLIGFLIWTPTSKYFHLTSFSNICVILPIFLYWNRLKMPKKPQINEYSDFMKHVIPSNSSSKNQNISMYWRLVIKKLGWRLSRLQFLPVHRPTNLKYGQYVNSFMYLFCCEMLCRLPNKVHLQLCTWLALRNLKVSLVGITRIVRK